MCYVEAKCSTRVPDNNIIYGSNSKVTIAKSKELQLASKYIYTNAKILGTCSIVRNFLNYKWDHQA
jgi:hypothetical protein